MNIVDTILKILNDKNMTKTEFANKLIDLEPRIGKNEEIPSIRTIYHVSSKGERELKVELVPYIAEVLHVSEQSLFDTNEKVRLRILKDILANANTNEKKVVNAFYLSQYSKQIANILQLIKYAPKSFVDKLEMRLQNLKKISEDM